MSEQQTSQRLVSLDAFRGATMALMVLVNDAGDGKHVYGPLQHAEWHGWTLTDTVFPSFLWIVGVAITLSLGKRVAAGASRAELMRGVLRRAAVIYALGLLVYLFPHFHLGTMRVLGVLQRIAICYLAASAIYLTASIRAQILWIVSLLGGYWLLMTLTPVPGFGAGRLDVEGNFAHYVDRMVLGAHNYVQTKTWDPEGIVSTLPALATALLGIMAGHILRMKRTLAERTTWLFFAGCLLVAAGLVCDNWLSINKKLWTSSFALFMAGLDFLIFAMFAWWIDGLGRRKAVRPLVVMGMNAIAIYMLSELLSETMNVIRWREGTVLVSLQQWLYRSCFAPLAWPQMASLLWAAAYTLLMYGAAWWLHRRGWFLKV
ncbi:MAG: DUF5009 domain-containing protein [Candidatus Solibacter usitatus]|nr:DUF5009 domain-containing protein [Candidatus Solibacter usitatus]